MESILNWTAISGNLGRIIIAAIFAIALGFIAATNTSEAEIMPGAHSF